MEELKDLRFEINSKANLQQKWKRIGAEAPVKSDWRVLTKDFLKKVNCFYEYQQIKKFMLEDVDLKLMVNRSQKKEMKAEKA